MSDDIARLGLRVDADGFVRADKAVSNFNRTAATAEQRANQLNKEVDGMAKFAQRATQAFGVLAASFGVREIIQYADAWRSVSNQIRLVTDSEEQFARVRQGVVAAAKNSNSELGATASLYSTLARYSGDLVKGDSELLRITETLNKSFAISGASAESQAGAIRQLSQALASGALRGDEFNSVNENAPRIMDAIAASLNMTKGELRAFAAEGNITSKIIIDAVRGMADEIDADYSKMDRTFAQYTQNAKTNLTEFLGSNEEVQSATKAAGEAILFASQHIDDMAAAIGIASLAMTANYIPALGITTKSLRAYFFATETATVATNALGQRTVTTTVTQSGLAASLARTRAALLSLAGPGAIVGVTAAAMYLLVQSEKAAANGAWEQAQGFDRVRENLGKLTKVELAHEIQAQQEIVTALRKKITAYEQLSDGSHSMEERIRKLNLQLTAEESNLALVVGQLNRLKEGFFGSGIAANSAEAYVWSLDQGFAQLTHDVFTAQDYLKQFDAAIDKNAGNTAYLTKLYGTANFALQQSAEAYVDLMAASGASMPVVIQDVDNWRYAINDTASAHQKLTAVTEAELKKMEDDWRAFRDSLSDSFADLVIDGGNVFDSIGKSFERMLAKMAGDLLASGVMAFFTGQNGFSLDATLRGAGTSGMLTSAAISKLAPGLAESLGLKSLFSGYQAVDAAQAAALNLPASAASGAGVIAGLKGALASVPGWGWALGGALALNSIFNEKETPSYNAGLLLNDLPGVSSDRKFALKPFESGLTPVGFNRRTTQDEATQVADYFRGIDSEVVKAGSDFGKTITAAMVQGLDERGLGSGIFLGSAREDGLKGMGLDVQGLSYARQLVESLRGEITDADLGRVLAETTVEDLVATLRDVLQGNMSDAEVYFRQYVEERIDYFGGATAGALDDIKKKADDFKFTAEDVARITGYSLTQVEKAFASVDDKAQDAADSLDSFGRIADYTRDYIAKMVDEQNHYLEQQKSVVEDYYHDLYDTQYKLYQALKSYMASLRTGDLSILSPREQLDAAKSEFQNLASVALNTSLGMDQRLKAAQGLQGAADTYLKEGQGYYASSAGYKDIFNEVMQTLEAAKFLGTNQPFEGSALENQMLAELQKLNDQMGLLPANMAASLAPLMSAILSQGILAGLSDRQIANVYSSLGPDAVKAANPQFEATTGKTIEDAAIDANEAKAALAEIQALGLSEKDTLDLIIAKAKQEHISSDRLGELLGLSQSQIDKNLALAGVSAFADGGYYPGGLALVGESGPELVNFSRPGMVYTADQTRDILGGGNTAALEDKIDRLIIATEKVAQAVVRLGGMEEVLMSEQTSAIEDLKGALNPRSRVGTDGYGKAA